MLKTLHTLTSHVNNSILKTIGNMKYHKKYLRNTINEMLMSLIIVNKSTIIQHFYIFTVSRRKNW